LAGILDLFCESHIADLEDTLEGLSLLFDDSYNTIVLPSTLSLEIVLHESTQVFGLVTPHCIVLSFDSNMWTFK